MARPIKDGLDYFPVDVVLDEKFELMEAEFGITGFAVIIKLFQKIYSSGYYCNWSDEVALLFSKNCGIDKQLLSTILQSAIKRNLLNKDLFFKHSILTSKGIQSRYFEAISRRKKTSVNEDYLLINIFDFFKDENINFVNADKNVVNVSINTQRKEKETKENKSKENSAKKGFFSSCNNTSYDLSDF